jgi:hypothetical protein
MVMEHSETVRNDERLETFETFILNMINCPKSSESKNERKTVSFFRITKIYLIQPFRTTTVDLSWFSCRI